jgi:hypothetical protein
MLLYAKTAPAALHRSDFWNCSIERHEAVGRGPKFRSGDFLAALMLCRISA